MEYTFYLLHHRAYYQYILHSHLYEAKLLLTFSQGNVPRATKEHARSPTSLPAANAATLPDSASRLDHASYVFGSSGGLVFGKGAASSSEFRPNFAHHATISDFHFGDDGGLLFGKRPGQAAMDNSMKKVPKSVKDAIKQAKLWAKKEMGGVKDADAEVVESNRILAKMGVKFGSPSMIH